MTTYTKLLVSRDCALGLVTLIVGAFRLGVVDLSDGRRLLSGYDAQDATIQPFAEYVRAQISGKCLYVLSECHGERNCVYHGSI